MEDLEEDLENLRPKRKIAKKKDSPKSKRPEKRVKLSPFIDDEAVEADTDESDDGDAESMFIILLFESE